MTTLCVCRSNETPNSGEGPCIGTPHLTTYRSALCGYRRDRAALRSGILATAMNSWLSICGALKLLSPETFLESSCPVVDSFAEGE